MRAEAQMNKNSKMPNISMKPDAAAVLGAAMSLANTLREKAAEARINLSSEYGGGDHFMRSCMKAATLFEKWACENIDFDATPGICWPYLLEDSFGPVYVKHYGLCTMHLFKEDRCSLIARDLEMKIKPKPKAE
jgi:hypothetical protein